jgi:hypothetical protein
MGRVLVHSRLAVGVHVNGIAAGMIGGLETYEGRRARDHQAYKLRVLVFGRNWLASQTCRVLAMVLDAILQHVASWGDRIPHAFQ